VFWLEWRCVCGRSSNRYRVIVDKRRRKRWMIWEGRNKNVRQREKKSTVGMKSGRARLNEEKARVEEWFVVRKRSR
jgi:hypothetical protein